MWVLLRAIEIADFEERLAKLEQQLKRRDGSSDEPPAERDQDSESRAATGEAGEEAGEAAGRGYGRS
jgi:hypothetical protein